MKHIKPEEAKGNFQDLLEDAARTGEDFILEFNDGTALRLHVEKVEKTEETKERRPVFGVVKAKSK